MPDRVPIRADEAAAVVVEAEPILTLPSDEFEVAGTRVETRVARRELDRPPMGVAGDVTRPPFKPLVR
jgi:hypothetical protein